MSKRPNVRRPPESQMIPEHKEERAADRVPEKEWPSNNFVLVAMALAGAIVLIGLGFVFEFIK